PHYPGLRRQTLIEDDIAIAAQSPVGALAELHDQPWVMEPRGTASRHFAEQTCRLAGFEPDVRYETADLHAHLALATSGAAVALVPGLMWMTARADAVRSPLPGAPRRTVFAALRATTT